MIKTIDLFAGVGGVALGLKMAKGFETLLVNDVDPDMCKAFSMNFPNLDVRCDSIANIEFKDQFSKKKIDLVIGGPPCQAYSTSGKRLLEDPRAFLYHQYYRCLNELRPRMFVYENVRGLLSMSGGALFSDLKALFSSLGYRVDARVLNAADFGVPQERERVIVVGVRDGLKFEYPQPTHRRHDDFSASLFSEGDLPPHLTVSDAISDLPRLEAGEESKVYLSEPLNNYQKLMRSSNQGVLHDHSAPRHGKDLLQVIRHVPEGGLKDDIPEKFRPKSGFPNSYGRLWWNRPSTTVTRNFGTPSSARCIHPLYDRALTTREGARLQSFPDSYRFFGSRAKMNLQIGNAVPPLLALAIANQVKKSFGV